MLEVAEVSIGEVAVPGVGSRYSCNEFVCIETFHFEGCMAETLAVCR